MDNKEIENDNLEETNDSLEIKPEDVTREINLDDLYDGAVNNTVVIDPISNNEVLMSNKKPNYTFIAIILCVFILLALYYINNKTNLINKAGEIKTTTTKIVTTKKVTDKGTLVCTYTSKSDAETQNVNYEVNYISDKITDSKFTYNVTSNTDSTSAVIDDLKSQYENLYLNNVTVVGNVIEFNKNSTGFSFTITTNYNKQGFENLAVADGQTILFVKPTTNDTIDSLQSEYSNKGFTCSINYDDGKKE